MECHFPNRETSWENLQLASLGIGEKLLQGFPEKLCLGFSVMFIPREIFLWLQKHFGREGGVCTPSFPRETWAGLDPRASLSRWMSRLGGGTVPRTRSGSRAGAWWGMKEVKVKQ